MYTFEGDSGDLAIWQLIADDRVAELAWGEPELSLGGLRIGPTFCFTPDAPAPADAIRLHGHFSHAVDQKAAAIVRALPPRS